MPSSFVSEDCEQGALEIEDWVVTNGASTPITNLFYSNTREAMLAGSIVTSTFGRLTVSGNVSVACRNGRCMAMPSIFTVKGTKKLEREVRRHGLELPL